MRKFGSYFLFVFRFGRLRCSAARADSQRMRMSKVGTCLETLVYERVNSQETRTVGADHRGQHRSTTPGQEEKDALNKERNVVFCSTLDFFRFWVLGIGGGGG